MEVSGESVHGRGGCQVESMEEVGKRRPHTQTNPVKQGAESKQGTGDFGASLINVYEVVFKK